MSLHQVARFGEYRIDRGAIFGVEREAEHAGIVGDVLRDAEPRADDDAGDRGTVQDVANADIGDADAVLVGDRFQRRRAVPGTVPIRPRHRSCCLYFCSEAVLSSPRPWLGTTEIFFRQQSAEHGAIGEQA